MPIKKQRRLFSEEEICHSVKKTGENLLDFEDLTVKSCALHLKNIITYQLGMRTSVESILSF